MSLQFGSFDQVGLHRQLLQRHKVIRWIRHALSANAEITVRIVSEEEGLRLNSNYRSKNYATNVLTFNYSMEPVVVADVILCGPVVAQEAVKLNKPLEEHYAHLIVHGVLHAQGWDHETNRSDAIRMETREIEILKQLRYQNPYL